MEPVGKLLVAAAAADAPKEATGRSQMFFVFITGADAGIHECVRKRTEERDWKHLLPDLVSKVAKLVLRSDVTDYIRLRAVCKAWRGAAIADPKLMGMDPFFFPRNWAPVSGNARREETRFVNNLTGASILLQVPMEYGEIIASAEGCLILASRRGCSQTLRLFNPVTRAVAYLPAVPCGSEVHAAGFVYDGDSHAHPTVVLCAVDDMKRIVYFEPGDTVWRLVDEEGDGELEPYSEGGLSVRGRFYVPTATGNVRKLELLPHPHLVYVARQEARHRCDGFLGLGVTSSLEPNADAHGGMLLLRFIGDNVEVFQVNLADGTGSLTLMEEQDIESCLLPWLTLGGMSK